MSQSLSVLNDATVLIVDDALLIALDVERILEDVASCQCMIMRKAEAQNLRPLKGYDARLIIHDYRASRDTLSDIEHLAAEVKAPTPLILLTTNGDVIIRDHAPPHVRVVEKPFSEADLIAAVRDVLSEN